MMRELVNNMDALAREIIASFKHRKENLRELREEVAKLLQLFEKERLEMRAELFKELNDFINNLETKVNRLLTEFEEERFKAERIWIEMEKEMERLRRDP